MQYDREKIKGQIYTALENHAHGNKIYDKEDLLQLQISLAHIYIFELQDCIGSISTVIKVIANNTKQNTKEIESITSELNKLKESRKESEKSMCKVIESIMSDSSK